MAAQREEITARPKSPRAAERRCAIEATSSDFGLLGDGIRIRRASDHHIMCDEGCQVRRVTVVRFAADYGGTAAGGEHNTANTTLPRALGDVTQSTFPSRTPESLN